MDCERYQEAIGDLVDGAPTDEARRIEVEKHLRECASCRALLADLRQIRAAAAHLPAEPPPERVWTHLAAKLPTTAPSPTKSGWAARLWQAAWPSRRAWAVPAVAAVAILALLFVVPRVRLDRGQQTASGPAAEKPAATPVHPSDAELVQSVETELQLAEQHYERAIAGLQQIASAGEGTLDPQLAATLKKNLGVIDQAIHDSRVALQTQPTNEPAQESLFEAFRRKVALLQDTVALINEMRKGNQAGAAKIVGGMNKS